MTPGADIVRDLAGRGLETWLLAETRRSRDRVRELRERYPSAQLPELASRLVDEKKKWASAGGALAGLFGMAALPADLALVAWLQLSLIVDLAVLCGRNLKSRRARAELLDIFREANDAARTASRASPMALARLGERLLAARGLRVLGRALPVVAAPVAAVLNNRDIQKAGDEALRVYAHFPKVLAARRADDD